MRNEETHDIFKNMNETTTIQYRKTGADIWESDDGVTIYRIRVSAACSGGSGSAGAWYFFQLDATGVTGDNHRTLKAAKAQAELEFAD